MDSENQEKPLSQEDLDKLLELELIAKKEELQQLNANQNINLDSDVDDVNPDEDMIEESKPIEISDYINLPPRLTDVSFQRSGELLDLKILKENIYLKSKRTYIKGLLIGVIIFVLGVI